MYFDYSGIVGLIILALDIWAIMKILQGGGPTDTKSFGSSSFCCCL